MNKPRIQLMIAGAQKAGTSSLLTYIGQHPEIIIHDELEFPYFNNDDLFSLGYDVSYSRLFGSTDPAGKVIAAKSAPLMYSADGCRRLHDHNSDALIVIMLRNPIHRAYSAYWHERRRGLETEQNFETALDAEDARLADSADKWRKSAYVYNGIYIPHMIRLMDQFGEDRVLAYTTEDLRIRPMETVQEIFRHAGVNDTVEPDVLKRHNTASKPRSESLASLLGRIKMSQGGAKSLVKQVLPQGLVRRTMSAVNNLNSEQFVPPSLAPETHERLREVFTEPNLELGTLLGRDLSSWNAPLSNTSSIDRSLEKES